MSTVAINEPASSELATPPALADSPNGTDLSAWVADLGNAYTLAERICRTPFAPKDFQGKPEAAAVAILHGKSLGLDPLASMSSIFVVSGRPGLYSRAMHAIVMAAGHEVWVESEAPNEVVAKGRRRGSDQITTSTWTSQRAKLAGYDSNKKYITEPIAMLRARALGDVCRVVAPDVLSGLAYNEADVAVMDPLDDLGEQVAPKPEAAKRKVTRKPRATAPAPDLPDVVNNAPQDEEESAAPAPEPVDTETGELPTEEAVEDGTQPADAAQIDAVVTALNAAGHTTKAAKQSAITEALGEPKPATQLTAFEAETLVTYFAEED